MGKIFEDAVFKLKRGRTTSWDSWNGILAEGEPGYDTTLNKIKIGDGVSAWNNLEYIGDYLEIY